MFSPLLAIDGQNTVTGGGVILVVSVDDGRGNGSAEMVTGKAGAKHLGDGRSISAHFFLIHDNGVTGDFTFVSVAHLEKPAVVIRGRIAQEHLQTLYTGILHRIIQRPVFGLQVFLDDGSSRLGWAGRGISWR